MHHIMAKNSPIFGALIHLFPMEFVIPLHREFTIRIFNNNLFE